MMSLARKALSVWIVWGFVCVKMAVPVITWMDRVPAPLDGGDSPATRNVQVGCLVSVVNSSVRVYMLLIAARSTVIVHALPAGMGQSATKNATWIPLVRVAQEVVSAIMERRAPVSMARALVPRAGRGETVAGNAKKTVTVQTANKTVNAKMVLNAIDLQVHASV